MNKYAIWNKTDSIITPIGEVISAEKWIEKHPVAGLSNITVVCAAGEINGAFFGTLGQMVMRYTNDGCDFSACTTDEEKIAAINAFETAKAEAAAAAAAEPTAEERTAAALEAMAAGQTTENAAAVNALLTGEEA